MMTRAVLALFLFSFAALAQQTDTNVAIAGFQAGGIAGLGVHGAVGGSLTVPVTRLIMPFFEANYSPLSSFAYTYGSDNTGKGLFRSGLVDVNGGVKLRFPGPKDLVPYVGFGAGVLHISSTDYLSGYSTTSTVHRSRSDFAGNASVGALYYFTPHFGFSVELKGYGGQNERLVRAAGGVFYQFP